MQRNVYEEGRGWQEGKRRTHTEEEVERVAAIKRAMKQERKYFLGPEHVQMRYHKTYDCGPCPSLWFIKDVVREKKLQSREPKKRTKGMDIVRRLCFPITTIVKLGRIQQAADFIGKKFIAGNSNPISIFSTCYYQWFELYQIWQTLAETTECAIGCLRKFWETHPVPNVLRIDNAMLFRGTGAAVAHIGKFLKFVLNAGVTPLFSAAYQSYTNPYIEGYNSTFGDKVWGQNRFTSLGEINRECDRFNAESQEFYEWKFKERLSTQGLRFLRADQEVGTEVLRSTRGKKITFLRQVERWTEQGMRSGIVVFNRFVAIPEPYLGLYVFVTLNLATATLHAHFERDKVSTEILHIPFPFTL